MSVCGQRVLLRELGETEFIRRHQCPVRSLAAFEKSELADDWRELMRLYMVRRTRSFIQDNYATTDLTTGRKYLTFPDGRRSYFPTRQPKTVTFTIDDHDAHDQYALLIFHASRRHYQRPHAAALWSGQLHQGARHTSHPALPKPA